ncbi:response regulator [Ramlibacter sp. PS3R-8]|uniref:response regulator n=1 Tax=Ramlibacter sp. PS3R-8 TaxID=3133437 RepID=UPI0030A5CE9A
MEVRVFLVEDLLRMRGLLDDMFASLGGIRVVAAATTEAEARLWLDENPGEWDVAVLDLVLEQGVGMNLIRHCKKVRPDGHVVVFSGFATPGVRKHCLELGADAVIDKAETASLIGLFDDLRKKVNAGP